MKKNLSKAIKILFSVGLLTWLFLTLDWDFVLTELQTVQSGYLLLFLLFQGVAMLCSAQKWRLIARYKDISFTVWEGLKIYLTGTFINNFLPSTIGGDIYRSVWLVGRGAPKSTAFSTVIFDRCTGLFLTLILALCGALFVSGELSVVPHFLTVSYVAAAGVLALFIGLVFFFPRAAIALIPWAKLRAFFEETVQYRKKAVWLEASLWGAFFMVAGLGISNYLLFLSLGYTLPFLPFLGLVFLMALYVSLPLSINNIGVKEWAYGVLFVLLGVSFETAVTVALLSRFLQTGISLLALPTYLLEKKQNLVTLPADSDTPSQSVMGAR